MNKRKQLLTPRCQSFPALLAARLAFAVFIVLTATSAATAIPASEYRRHIQQAITALDTVSQSDEMESPTAYGLRDAETIKGVRALLPASETVEWNAGSIKVDNAWLHHDLSVYTADGTNARYDLLKRITERLKGLDERITELEKAGTVAGNKAEENRKLKEILQRP